MPKRKKYPKLPNGYGSIKRLSGKNRTNPFGVYPPTKEFDLNGIPVAQKAICLCRRLVQRVHRPHLVPERGILRRS
jgi:hypothetical protein